VLLAQQDSAPQHCSAVLSVNDNFLVHSVFVRKINLDLHTRKNTQVASLTSMARDGLIRRR
jgi:hypothetical protein